jgi:hypothetical protein
MASKYGNGAKRPSARKSSEPKTERGKNPSRVSARRDAMQAVIDSLPAVDPKAAKERYEAWAADWQPLDTSERICLQTAVFYSLEVDRVRLAQHARIVARIENAPAEKARREQKEVTALAKRLLPKGLKLQKSMPRRGALPEHPASIVLHLERTTAGCHWMLDRWAELKAILNGNLPLRASDKFKLVRLLGREPLAALDDPRVARLFLAFHVINGEQGSPYQEITAELNDNQRICFESNIAARNWNSLRPEDATRARNLLLLIVTQAVERLELTTDQGRERDSLDAETAAARLSFDFTPDGERLRRYEWKCDNARLNAIDQFHKFRRARTRRKNGAQGALSEQIYKAIEKARRAGAK